MGKRIGRDLENDTMNDSRIETSPGGAIAFVGADAISLYQVLTLKQAISLHQKCGMIPTRGYTISKMLALATRYTGKTYKGKTKHADAIADLESHLAALRASLPIERRA